jgi:small subunit ribosomal protein S13
MRIAGINIPDKKRIDVALRYIYGIGPTTAREVLKQAQIDSNKRAQELTAPQINIIKEILEKNYKIEGDLRREISLNIKQLKDIGCYRGMRHMRHLPSRGQRTKTNSRTVRGNVRKTAGSGKRPAASPT